MKLSLSPRSPPPSGRNRPSRADVFPFHYLVFPVLSGALSQLALG